VIPSVPQVNIFAVAVDPEAYYPAILFPLLVNKAPSKLHDTQASDVIAPTAAA